MNYPCFLIEAVIEVLILICLVSFPRLLHRCSFHISFLKLLLVLEIGVDLWE